jgi:CHAT domain-containing protein
MSHDRRRFMLVTLALRPQWPWQRVGRAVSGAAALQGSAAALSLAAGAQAAVSAPAGVLETAPFLSAELARAVGMSMVAADWRGDYALAARLADRTLDEARRAGAAQALCDALCSRAAVALLAGDAGRSLALLDEAAPLAGDDAVRLAWVRAYASAAHVRRFQMLPGGTRGWGEELKLRAGKPRWYGRSPAGAEAADWLGTEYDWAMLQRNAALRARDPQRGEPLDGVLTPPYRTPPPSLNARVDTTLADLLRRSGRRVEALGKLTGLRSRFTAAGDLPGVLATALLEGDWWAAPLSTPEELNLCGDETVTAWWEAQELQTQDIDIPQARLAYGMAQTLAQTLQAPRALATLSLRRGVLARVEGDLPAAADQARQAMRAFEACGDRAGYWTARWHAALAAVAAGQMSSDTETARGLAQWGRNEGSLSHALGLGLIGARAANQTLVREGTPERAMAVYQLTEALFLELDFKLPLAQTLMQRAALLSALGHHTGATTALVGAADALEQRVIDDQGLPRRETAQLLVQVCLQINLIAHAQSEPDLVEQAAARILRDGARIQAGVQALEQQGPGKEQEARDIKAMVAYAVQSVRPVAADVACMRGLEELRSGEPARAELQFSKLQAIAATAADAQFRSHLILLTFVAQRGRRDYAAAADAAQAMFKLAQASHDEFERQMVAGAPEGSATPDRLNSLRSAAARNAHDSAFSSLVSVNAFEAAAVHLAALERLAGPQWWQASKTPWVERADCARLQAGLGRLDEAARLYDDAIALVENRRTGLRSDVLKTSLAASPPIAAMYLDAAHTALKRALRAPDDDSRRRLRDEAFDRIERVKARGLLDLLGGGRARGPSAPGDARAASGTDIPSLLRAWQQGQLRVATWQALQAREPAGQSQDPRRAAFLQQKINDESASLAALDARLSQQSAQQSAGQSALKPARAPAFASAQAALLKPDQVAKLLPARAVLLQMALLDDDLLLCAISASGEVAWHSGAVDAVGLRRDMRHVRRLCEQPGPLQDFDARAQRLSAALIEPLAAVLDQHDQLIIVPHGPGYAVPFASLPWRGAPLGARFAVSQIPSASVLPYMLRTAPARPASILAIGNPARMASPQTLDAPAQPMAALPGAEAEARAVAAVFPGSRVLVGAQASAAAVRSELPKHRILHFATHGVLSDPAPMQSALLLADGQALTLDELLGLQLDADLAVLSACNTGRGKEDAGNDVLGFTRGLLMAGVRSAVVSLWPVDDVATRLLMERFYAELQRGRTSAAALQSAQQALRGISQRVSNGAIGPADARGATAVGRSDSSGAGDYSHPHYWAPFVLVG